ncbi:Gaa1-like protein [Lipomyces japonicus]|uniref:Gaa1-like protein n=1 Tax=Lipomyces japonicus TaxID=56871 RepID=UPI0034CEB499
MTLFGVIYRRVRNRRNGSNLTAIASILSTLSIILALSGITWLFILPIENQSRNNYISENALLPGQALTYFHGSEENIVRAFRQEIRTVHAQFGLKSDYKRAETVRKWIDDIGYKSALHNWTLSPFSNHNGDNAVGQKFGTNVYGVLHAPRGDTTESMILCAPWLSADGQVNEGGVAVAVSLARYLTRWSIWSKDIILLIPSDPTFGLSSWITDYHFSSMTSPSGSIQAALVLDLPGTDGRFDELEIEYVGLNGQLPNLDLYNTVMTIAGHMSVKVSIHGTREHDAGSGTYQARAATLFKGIAEQALAGFFIPAAGHAVFSGWRIDAVTLRGKITSDNNDRGGGAYDQMLFGRITEASIRSINNLLEHLHQSFFFYLLLTTRRFVSIGTYLPSAMLVGASFTVKGISQWLISSAETNTASLNHVQQAFHAFAVFAITIACCTIVFAAAAWAPSQYYSVIFVAIFLVILPLSRPASSASKLRALANVYAGLFLTTLATLNFSLALLLGVIFAPLAHVPAFGATLVSKLLPVVTIAFTSPFVIVAGGLLYGYHHDQGQVAQVSTWRAIESMLTTAVWNWRALGVWGLLPVFFLVWIPFWVVSSLAVMTNVNYGNKVQAHNLDKKRSIAEKN